MQASGGRFMAKTIRLSANIACLGMSACANEMLA
jgi:hypothetical protein